MQFQKNTQRDIISLIRNRFGSITFSLLCESSTADPPHLPGADAAVWPRSWAQGWPRGRLVVPSHCSGCSRWGRKRSYPSAHMPQFPRADAPLRAEISHPTLLTPRFSFDFAGSLAFWGDLGWEAWKCCLVLETRKGSWWLPCSSRASVARAVTWQVPNKS